MFEHLVDILPRERCSPFLMVIRITAINHFFSYIKHIFIFKVWAVEVGDKF